MANSLWSEIQYFPKAFGIPDNCSLASAAETMSFQNSSQDSHDCRPKCKNKMLNVSNPIDADHSGVQDKHHSANRILAE